jgi:hypothetical protein
VVESPAVHHTVGTKLREGAVMIAAAQWPRATRKEYAAAERAAEYTSEYIGGYVIVIAMTGASRAHTISTGISLLS